MFPMAVAPRRHDHRRRSESPTRRVNAYLIPTASIKTSRERISIQGKRVRNHAAERQKKHRKPKWTLTKEMRGASRRGNTAPRSPRSAKPQPKHRTETRRQD